MTSPETPEFDLALLREFSLDNYSEFTEIWQKGLEQVEDQTKLVRLIGMGKSSFFRYGMPNEEPHPPLFGIALMYLLADYIEAERNGVQLDPSKPQRDAARRATLAVLKSNLT